MIRSLTSQPSRHLNTDADAAMRNPLGKQSMNRRTALQVLSSVALFSATNAALPAKEQLWPKVTILGNPAGRTIVSVPSVGTGLSDEIVRDLTKDFKVCLLNVDETPPIAPERYTAEWVCNSILAALTRAGVERFTWYGFSFGAVIGLQVATRSPRAEALLCGGWPPLGAQYRETLAVVDARIARGEGNRYTQQFYRSIQDWPERDPNRALGLSTNRLCRNGGSL